MNLIIYQAISVINLLGCVIGFVLMIRVVVSYEIMKEFATYYLNKLGFIFFIAFNNIATYADPVLTMDVNGWPLKLAGTWSWVLVFMFCRSIKKVSYKYPPKEKTDKNGNTTVL